MRALAYPPAASAQAAIINTSSLKLAPSNVSVASDSCIIITPPEKGYRQRGAPKREVSLRSHKGGRVSSVHELCACACVCGSTNDRRQCAESSTLACRR